MLEATTSDSTSTMCILCILCIWVPLFRVATSKDSLLMKMVQKAFSTVCVCVCMYVVDKSCSHTQTQIQCTHTMCEHTCTDTAFTRSKVH